MACPFRAQFGWENPPSLVACSRGRPRRTRTAAISLSRGRSPSWAAPLFRGIRPGSRCVTRRAYRAAGAGGPVRSSVSTHPGSPKPAGLPTGGAPAGVAASLSHPEQLPKQRFRRHGKSPDTTLSNRYDNRLVFSALSCRHQCDELSRHAVFHCTD